MRNAIKSSPPRTQRTLRRSWGLLCLLCLLCVLCGTSWGADVSAVVQVGVNYGPGKSTMISGAVVGDGRFVITQGDVLTGAKEIAVALTSTDVLDATIVRVDRNLNVGLIELPRTQNTTLSLMTEFPPGAVEATVIGAPSAFETARSSVHLVPVEGARRWTLTPGVPPQFRGAPIVSLSGTMLGIVVGDAAGNLVGIPSSELASLLAKPEEKPSEPAPPPPEKPAPQPAVVPAPEPPVQKPPEPVAKEEASETPALHKEEAAPESGAEAWEKLIRDEPDNPNVRFQYADALASVKQYANGVRVLEQARDAFPGKAEVYWRLAFAYWQQSLHKSDGSNRSSMEPSAYRKAMGAFTKYLELEPNGPHADEARERLQTLKRAGRR